MTDGQGNAPTFDVDMVLTSDEMEYPTSISVDNISNGNYTFFDLYPATYTLTIKYNSFQIENIVHIPKMALMTINLHNLKVLVKDNWDLPPGIKLGMILKSDEFLKPVVMLGDDLSAGEYLFADLYPANYLLTLSYKLFSIEKQVRISYENDEMLEVSFPAEFNITVNVFDSHGNLMPGVKVLITREGKELEDVTAEGGNVTFQIPPANYVSKIYSNDRLIAERRIDCSNDQTFTIVTTEEPLYPFIIMALMIIMAIGAAYISHRKKDVMTFLKILAVALAIIAVVSPWWMIQGSSFSPQVETSTNLFLTPVKLVTITSTADVVAGEFSSLYKTFEFAMSFLPILIALGCICIISNMVLKQLDKKNLSKIIFLAGIVLLLSSFLIFSIGMSQLAEFGVGSFIGSGNLDISIPGEGTYETLSCSWGPSTGFYLLLLSIVILVIIAGIGIKKDQILSRLYRSLFR